MQNLDLSFAQDPNTLALGLIAGLVPAVIWLFFWTRENSEFPKQAGILFKAFLCGAIAVMAVLPVQEFMLKISSDPSVLNVLWAASEEVLKYLAFAVAILSARTINRPVDYAVYMMVCALGFAGLENGLYFLGSLQAGDTAGFVLSASLRFLGTTLLHALTSSCVGIGIGFAFFESRTRKVLYGLAGLAVGITIHSVFNAYSGANNGANVLPEIIALWILAIGALVIYERLRFMGGIEHVRALTDKRIAKSESIFKDLIAQTGVTVIDERPFHAILAEKGIPVTSLEEMRAALEADYARHLEARGAAPDGAAIAAKSLMGETMSPKTVSNVLATLKENTIPSVLASKVA